jgi:hypothetical protein
VTTLLEDDPPPRVDGDRYGFCTSREITKTPQRNAGFTPKTKSGTPTTITMTASKQSNVEDSPVEDGPVEDSPGDQRLHSHIPDAAASSGGKNHNASHDTKNAAMKPVVTESAERYSTQYFSDNVNGIQPNISPTTTVPDETADGNGITPGHSLSPETSESDISLPPSANDNKTGKLNSEQTSNNTNSKVSTDVTTSSASNRTVCASNNSASSPNTSVSSSKKLRYRIRILNGRQIRIPIVEKATEESILRDMYLQHERDMFESDRTKVTPKEELRKQLIQQEREIWDKKNKDRGKSNTNVAKTNSGTMTNTNSGTVGSANEHNDDSIIILSNASGKRQPSVPSDSELLAAALAKQRDPLVIRENDWINDVLRGKDPTTSSATESVTDCGSQQRSKSSFLFGLLRFPLIRALTALVIRAFRKTLYALVHSWRLGGYLPLIVFCLYRFPTQTVLLLTS